MSDHDEASRGSPWGDLVRRLRRRLRRAAGRPGDESRLTALAAELDRAVHAWLHESLEVVHPSQGPGGMKRKR